jgi:hypothetical protein
MSLIKTKTDRYHLRPRLSQEKKTTRFRIDIETVRKAEREIASCEACTPDEAEVPIEFVLDCITGSDPSVTDYELAEPARCPRCGAAVETGYWRWIDSGEGRKVFIVPGTLVVLTDD